MSNRSPSGDPPRWRRYLRFLGPDVGADVDDELAFHLAMIEAEYLEAGMDPEAARVAARQRFGNYTQIQCECLRIGEERMKMTRRAERFGALGHDVRYTLRTLGKNPGFTVATVLVLALGLGATTAIFSIANSVLLRPLGYVQPDRLVRIFATHPAGGEVLEGSVSLPNFEDWRTRARSFETLAIAGYPETKTLRGRGDAERLSAVPVGADLFPLLGIRPLLGRSLAPGEDRLDALPVVVLSERAWRSRFGADAGILGTTLSLDGEAHTVIGIMPAQFRFPAGAEPPDVWVPLRASTEWATSRSTHAYVVLGRLAPGVSIDAAQAEMAQIAARLAEEYPAELEGRGARVRSLHETVVGGIQPVLLMLFGAVGLLLVISCANAASLLLARAIARQREVAIRTALGASRARVVRQFLAESLTLAGLGAALGLALAWVSLRAISLGAGPLLPRAAEIGIDARVVAFLIVVAALTGAVFGLVPALQTARAEVQRHLREGSRQNSGGRGAQAFHGTLVVTQIALSLVLLIGAGLLMRTFVALLGTETGMATEPVLTLKLGSPADRYETIGAAIDGFYAPMLERVRALPGVREAGMINLLPLENWGNSGDFGIAGTVYERAEEMPFSEIRWVSPGYFEAMGIPLLLGRTFTPHDDAAAPRAVIINRALAERYFPGEDPVGQQLTGFGPGPTVIVGVVGSVRQATLDSEPRPERYYPYAQLGPYTLELSLVVRTAAEPLALARAIRDAIRETAPQQAVFDVRPMQQVVSASVSDRRLYLWLLVAFAAVAVMLAVTGIYGVIAYSVVQRKREFGIRLALGANEGRVIRLVFARGARLAALGIAMGLPAAYALSQMLASLLYGVAAVDPLTYAGVALALGAVALVASYLPAHRAARVDPMEAFRAD